MTSAPPRPPRPPRLWVLFAALVVCVGQTVAAAHVHVDEHEEEECTLCAISDPGHVLDIGWADARPPEWCRPNNVPLFSAIVAPRPYEVACSRAPPVSVS